jgi:glycosyltransferase involved in cell wall biosynthesis
MPRPTPRLLHAVHDFLPRHAAGSEVYVANLCQALGQDHHVWVLAAEFDPDRPHASLTWRVHDGLAVVELVNNWRFGSFEETYRSADIERAIDGVLDAVEPDVVHVHSLLNLAFALPRLARARGVPVVATLHDYTLVCASGGQRVHRSASHLCRRIEPDRCARCFAESPHFAQMTLGLLPAVASAPAARLARRLRPWLPWLASAPRALRGLSRVRVTPEAIDARLQSARQVFADVDLFVAPSASLASEYAALGIPAEKLQVRDYGFPPVPEVAAATARSPLRIGYVGTITWHKGVHVLVEAVRALRPGTYGLSIHGDPDVSPEYVTDLRRQAGDLPVEFAGPFTRADLGRVYEGLDVLVVPSLWLENSPLVIHEAFMFGRPVVASNLGGIPDLVAHGRNGLLVEAGSASALAAALGSLIARPQLVGDLARGIPPVTSIEDDAQAWRRAYEAVAARGAAGGR